ncbi:hypothetical protein GQ53DRAFT_779982 [Thozetella sp. PMI_491]|nr:hypothetical protein GQ53DRAFT_779982 [Thozetella sp. PMI_491]
MIGNTSFVIEDVKVFTGQDFIEKGFVHVGNGRVISTGVGKFEDKVEHKQLMRLSRPGDTVIPGLIDAHIHAFSGNLDSTEQSLRFGVTTVFDMHNDPEDNEKLKKVCLPQDKAMHADFKCAGYGAIVEGGWPIPVLRKEFEHMEGGTHIAEHVISSLPKLRTPADAAPFVASQVHENGASYIKMFHELGDSLGMKLPPPPEDVQRAVVSAAHAHGVVAVGHAFSSAGALALLQAGADGLTHVFLDRPPPEQLDEIVNTMLSRGAHCNPTLGLCASQTAECADLASAFVADPFAQRMLADRFREPGKPLGFASAQKPRSSIANAYETTRSLYQAGVPLVVGSDAAGKGLGTTYGLGVHVELFLLVHEIGLSPQEALRCATSIPAGRFGFGDRGLIEAGRKADLVLIEGDVAVSLADERPHCLPVKAVWRDGIPASPFQ